MRCHFLHNSDSHRSVVWFDKHVPATCTQSTSYTINPLHDQPARPTKRAPKKRTTQPSTCSAVLNCTDKYTFARMAGSKAPKRRERHQVAAAVLAAAAIKLRRGVLAAYSDKCYERTLSDKTSISAEKTSPRNLIFKHCRSVHCNLHWKARSSLGNVIAVVTRCSTAVDWTSQLTTKSS